MTDPTPERRDGSPALEPWAVELLEREGVRSDPESRAELARTVALLRGLPEPERSPDLADRTLRAIAEERSRPRVLRVAFGAARRLATPPAALALAAGVAGLLAITVAPGGPLAPERPGPAIEIAAAGPAPARVAEPDAGTFRRPNPIRRRSTPTIRPQLVGVSAFSAATSPEPRRYHPAPFEYSHVRGLDRQLNQLMIDPDAFVERLERMVQRDHFIARLADRAAARGDAPEIALRVRQSRHPLAAQLVNRLLRATLVASVSSR